MSVYFECSCLGPPCGCGGLPYSYGLSSSMVHIRKIRAQSRTTRPPVTWYQRSHVISATFPMSQQVTGLLRFQARDTPCHGGGTAAAVSETAFLNAAQHFPKLPTVVHTPPTGTSMPWIHCILLFIRAALAQLQQP